jgi:uncharacterized protein (TIGR04255 family)
MGKKLKAAPVFFTIMQVKFNPILSLLEYIPQLQERLRKAGFPDMQQGFVATINLGSNAASAAAEGNSPSIPVQHNVRYLFGNMNRTASFVVDPSAISFQVTEYEVFEIFVAEFMKGLQAVHETIGLSYTDRLGLRYLDAVLPKQEEALKDYLTGSILGLAEKVEGTELYSFSETVMKMGDVSVRSRATIQTAPLAFPPDLLGLGLTVHSRFQNLSGRHAVIDTDGWMESREPMDLERIKRQFEAIHDGITSTFKASITSHALKVWA